CTERRGRVRSRTPPDPVRGLDPFRPRGYPSAVTTRATPRDRLSQSAELQRKLIHLASVVVPLGVWVMPRAASIAVLSALTVTAFGIEWSRRHLRGVRHFFLRRTRRLLRGHERSAIAGA